MSTTPTSELKDWRELFQAFAALPLPEERRRVKLWPNNWHQDCAMVAFFIDQAANRKAEAPTETSGATPRTDAHLRQEHGPITPTFAGVRPEFARQLERDAREYKLELSRALDREAALSRDLAAVRKSAGAEVEASAALEYALKVASDRGWVMDAAVYEKALARLRAKVEAADEDAITQIVDILDPLCRHQYTATEPGPRGMETMSVEKINEQQQWRERRARAKAQRILKIFRP